MGSPDVLAMTTRAERAALALRSCIEELRSERTSPRAIGEVIDLKATTVRQLLIEWGID